MHTRPRTSSARIASAGGVAAVDPPAATPPAEAILALLVLGLVCTAAAFVIYSRLIAEIGPGRALVITYVAPVVAVALGVTILGERPGAGAIAGLLLIIAGSWLSTDGRLPPGRVATLAAALRRTRGRRAAAGEPEGQPSSTTMRITTTTIRIPTAAGTIGR